jgi:VIT1/CCC1 family predicted Fe2+/Mn2+ transporter
VAGIITLLVFGSTFPLVIPFMVMDNAWLALRASHAIAVAFLFFLGWRIGRWSGASPFASGALFAIVGAVLAVTCVALGG